MSMKKLDKETIWVIRGKQRKELFLNLPERPFLPNKLRKEINEKFRMNLSLREMSRHLKGFESKNLVECLNKKDPYNHIYYLAKKGRKIKKEVSSLNL